MLSQVVEHCSKLFDAVIPVRCAMCGNHGEQICAMCRRALRARPLLFRAARGDTPDVLALGPYEGRLRSAVLSLKFRNRKNAAAILGIILAEKLRCQIHAVVPVPLHPHRLRSRGFNQAEAIGDGIGSTLGVPMRSDALARVKETQAQSSLALTRRGDNVRDAFHASFRAAALHACAVLLVDDVATTGSTLAACARALRHAGVARVTAATLAIKL